MGYAIACGHELTAEAAQIVFEAGGNAFDAAVAAFAASWVVEPCMSGPGGGGFAVVEQNGKPRSLDFFTQTPGMKLPAEQTDFRPVVVNFGGTTELFHYGYGSVAVPGAVDGLFTLYNMGARMPMLELLQPAIKYASEGHVLVPFQRYDMELLQEIIYSSECGRRLFFHNDELKTPGDVMRLPQLATFLDFIAREGRDEFYLGEISSRISEDSEAQGGHIRREDLEKYKVGIGKGASFQFDGLKITAPGGLSVGSKILESIVVRTQGSGLRGHQRQIMDGMYKTHLRKHLWFDPSWNVKQGGTSHISIIDSNGSAVSLSMSLGEGSGCFVDGTDIQMNNMLGEAALLPSGWHSWYPDHRLQSMMTPVVAVDPSTNTVIAAGSGGASRIPFAIAQVMDHFIRVTRHMPAAVRAPRVHWNGELWQAEPMVERPDDIPIEEWNAWEEQSLYFGGVHVAEQTNGHFSALGDSRRDGVAQVAN